MHTPLDVVMGSVHAIRGWVYTNGGEALEKWKTVDVAAVWQEYFDLVGQMADTGCHRAGLMVVRYRDSS